MSKPKGRTFVATVTYTVEEGVSSGIGTERNIWESIKDYAASMTLGSKIKVVVKEVK